MKQVTTGYYRLTADVKNPKPDRRSKRRKDCQEVWPAGTIVFVKDESAQRLKHLQEIAGERLPEDTVVLPLGQVRFEDGTQVLFSFEGSSNNFPEERQGNPIFDAIEPAPKTLGQVLKQADWRAEDLLALLIDSGKITLDDVEQIKKHDLTPEVDGNNWQVRDAATDAFQKRHGIS